MLLVDAQATADDAPAGSPQSHPSRGTRPVTQPGRRWPSMSSLDASGRRLEGARRARHQDQGSPDGVMMSSSRESKSEVQKAAGQSSAQAGDAATLPESMTGKASPAKAAVGDGPVFAYIASLPQPQRSIAELVDALAAQSLPGLQRSVKWGMSYYGVGDGWCFVAAASLDTSSSCSSMARHSSPCRP